METVKVASIMRSNLIKTCQLQGRSRFSFYFVY